MSYVYLLAGENLELAEAELRGFLNSQGVSCSINRGSRLAETEEEPGQLRRLALVHEVCKVLEKGDLEDLDIEYRPEKSYEVRAVEVEEEHDKPALQEQVGEILGTEDNSVDLENPEEQLRLYLFEDRYVLGRLVLDIDRSLFEKRKNQNRPFSSPISLDPVTARVLVNLSEVPAGGHILDPFCGTGGILIEAGLCGIGVHGLDVSKKMVEGTTENLEEYGIIVHDIRQNSVQNAQAEFEDGFDSVVTDLPYGKASKVKEEPIKGFLDAHSDLSNGKTVFMYNKPELNDLKHDFEIYIHKNLTRYIYILD